MSVLPTEHCIMKLHNRNDFLKVSYFMNIMFISETISDDLSLNAGCKAFELM